MNKEDKKDVVIEGGGENEWMKGRHKRVGGEQE